MSPFLRKFTSSDENFKHKVNKEGEDSIKNFHEEISKFETIKSFKLTDKKSRKLKRIPIHNLQVINSTLRRSIKKVNIKGWKSHFEIRHTNKVVGFTPDYIGHRPSFPVSFDNIFIKAFGIKGINYYMRNNPEISDSIIKSLSNYREVFEGSYDSNSNHLRTFFSDNNIKSLKADELMKIALMSDWFNSSVLEFNDPREMAYITNYNPKANNGHYTSKLLKCKQKGYSINGAYINACRLYKDIREKPLKNFSLWDVFSREKDVKTNIEFKNDVTTRVVLNPEHHVTHLNSWVFQKLITGNSTDPNCRYLIEKEYDGVKLGKLDKRSEGYDYVVDADWSRFDSTNDTEYLKAAGILMFNNSIKNEKDKRFFYFIISSFITKYVAVPPGIVVELNRGNPSGHPGVTAVNCFVNLLRWAVIGYKIYGDKYHENMDITVYGDDALIWFKEHENLSKIDNIINDLEFEGEPIFNRLFPLSLKFIEDQHSKPDFLKRRDNFGVLCWNREKLLDKIFYQSKKRSVKDQINLLREYIETGPGDDEMNNFIKGLVLDIVELSKEGHFNNEAKIYGECFLTEIDEVIKNKIFHFTSKENESFLSSYEKEVELAGFSLCEYQYKKDNFNKISMEAVKSLYYLTYSNQIFNMYKEDFIKSFNMNNSLVIEYNQFKVFKFNNPIDIGVFKYDSS